MMMLMTFFWMLAELVSPTTPPPPIQGFDRWEPAALFWIEDAFGNRQVDEGPNHDHLNVSKTGIETRSILEFDLEALPEEFDRITLRMLITNIDAGPPVEVVEFFHYTGDGEEGLEDWDAGTLFWVFDHPYPEVEKYRLRLDVTDLVRRYRDGGRRYLGFRLSAPSFARFRIGKTVGLHDPNPFFAIHHDNARTDSDDFTDSSDVWPFATCMVGPDDFYTVGCLLQWDYNDDEHVDLADLAIFQAMFDE